MYVFTVAPPLLNVKNYDQLNIEAHNYDEVSIGEYQMYVAINCSYKFCKHIGMNFLVMALCML